MNLIFDAIHRSSDEIREQARLINSEDEFRRIIEKINEHAERVDKCSKIESFCKIPACYTNRGNKSFPTLLYNGVDRTIEQGCFGQLDKGYYDMCYRVYSICASRLPLHESDFSKIFTFMGAIPLPVVVPPPSTRIIRVNNGLPAEIKDKTAIRMRRFVGQFFKKNFFIPKDFVFKIKSTGNPGFPDALTLNGTLVSKDSSPYVEESFRSFKKAIVIKENQCLGESKELENCLLSNDLDTLFSKFGKIYMYTDQHRGQPDVSSKVRKGYTRDSWDINNPDKDKEIELDKTRAIQEYYGNFEGLFKKYGDFEIKSKKNRFVFAESGSTNTSPNLILSCIRHNYGLQYNSTYKCGDPISINEKLSRYFSEFNINLINKDILCFDITQFDNSISPLMLESYIRGIAEVSEPLANELAKLSTAPGLTNEPYINLDPRSKRNKHYLSGNPFDLSTFRFGTSPSGTADVSEKAKIICSFFVLDTFFDEFVDQEKVLKGEDPSFFFMNLGDNNFIIADKTYRIEERLNNSDMFKIDISKELIFGGCIADIDYDNNFITFRYNPGSILMKILAPERDLKDPMRSSYSLGTEFRSSLANEDFHIALILESIDRVMYDMFFCSPQLRLCRQVEFNSNDKSVIYEELQKYVSAYGRSNLSNFFFDIIDSGGDKLFYTSNYEKLNQEEKKIIDQLFFSTFEHEEISNILDFYNIS